MLTTKTLSQYLGYKDDSAIRHLIARGKIKAEKIGRDWLISDLEYERVDKIYNQHNKRK